jgi:hypothetical protein
MADAPGWFLLLFLAMFFVVALVAVAISFVAMSRYALWKAAQADAWRMTRLVVDTHRYYVRRDRVVLRLGGGLYLVRRSERGVLPALPFDWKA